MNSGRFSRLKNCSHVRSALHSIYPPNTFIMELLKSGIISGIWIWSGAIQTRDVIARQTMISVHNFCENLIYSSFGLLYFWNLCFAIHWRFAWKFSDEKISTHKNRVILPQKKSRRTEPRVIWTSEKSKSPNFLQISLSPSTDSEH